MHGNSSVAVVDAVRFLLSFLVRHSFANLTTQRLQKREQCSFVFRGKTKFAHRRVKMRIGVPAVIVEVDDVLQRGETSVVHVRGGACDLAQGWRLECAEMFVAARH